MQQQEPEPCEYCLDVLGLDAARLCQRTFDPEPQQLPLPLSPPPIVLPRVDPSGVALPLSPPIRFDRLTDMSNASFVPQPRDSAYHEGKRSAQNNELVPSKPASEPEKDDERKYISIRGLFDDDGMEDARNPPIPPEVMDYVRQNPVNPNSIWYPDWYRYPELRHLIPNHTRSDSLPPPSIPQRYTTHNTQYHPPAHRPWTHYPPPTWFQHRLPRAAPPYETTPYNSLPPSAPDRVFHPQSLPPQTTFEILFANLTIGLPPTDIHAIFRYRWRSLPHNTYSIQLNLLDDLLEVLDDGGYEWSEHAFEPWVGREYELQKLEDRMLRELEVARIGVIGDGRRRG